MYYYNWLAPLEVNRHLHRLEWVKLYVLLTVSEKQFPSRENARNPFRLPKVNLPIFHYPNFLFKYKLNCQKENLSLIFLSRSHNLPSLQLQTKGVLFNLIYPSQQKTPPLSLERVKVGESIKLWPNNPVGMFHTLPTCAHTPYLI